MISEELNVHYNSQHDHSQVSYILVHIHLSCQIEKTLPVNHPSRTWLSPIPNVKLRTCKT